MLGPRRSTTALRASIHSPGTSRTSASRLFNQPLPIGGRWCECIRMPTRSHRVAASASGSHARADRTPRGVCTIPGMHTAFSTLHTPFLWSRVSAKWHNYCCTAKQQAIITRRAKDAGMSRSAFMVACALHDEPADPELMPAADEQEGSPRPSPGNDRGGDAPDGAGRRSTSRRIGLFLRRGIGELGDHQASRLDPHEAGIRRQVDVEPPGVVELRHTSARAGASR